MRYDLSMKKLIPTNFKTNSKHLTLGVLTFISRLKVLPANVSPLGSFGFFSDNPWLFLISIVAFDVLVGGLYKGFWLTYVGFMMYPLLGTVAARHWQRQVALLPLASLLFFLISNLGVWWYWFDHTLADLVLCYTVALPFYTRTVIGDVVFGYGYIAYTLLKPKLSGRVSGLARLFPGFNLT